MLKVNEKNKAVFTLWMNERVKPLHFISRRTPMEWFNHPNVSFYSRVIFNQNSYNIDQILQYKPPINGYSIGLTPVERMENMPSPQRFPVNL